MINKASDWVKYCLSKIPLKNKVFTALDLACGYGRNTILLADIGCKVVAVDLNLSCLTSFKGKNILKIQTDLEKVSAWPITKNFFDLVIVNNFLCRHIFKAIEDSLKKNGYLIYETFAEGHEKFGKPRSKDFLLKKDELLFLTKNLKLIFYEEVKVMSGDTRFIKNRILCRNV